ncbi:MAG TPA: PhoH family protein, partial [Burkholderiaceae bacterium]
MPLPKPPAQRASLLSAADFDSQSAPQPGKRPQKTRAAVEPSSPAVVELYAAPHAPGAAIAKSVPVIPAKAV